MNNAHLTVDGGRLMVGPMMRKRATLLTTRSRVWTTVSGFRTTTTPLEPSRRRCNCAAEPRLSSIYTPLRSNLSQLARLIAPPNKLSHR